MVKLPDQFTLGGPESLQVRTPIPSAGDVNATAIGEAMGAFGHSMQDAGKAINKRYKEQQDQEDALDLMNADTEHRQRLYDLQRSFDTDTDYATHRPRYYEQANDITNDVLSRIKRPELQKKLYQKWMPQNQIDSFRIGDQADKMMQEQRYVAFENDLARNFDDFQKAPDDDQRRQRLEDIEHRIAIAEQSRLITPKAAVKTREFWLKKMPQEYFMNGGNPLDLEQFRQEPLSGGAEQKPNAQGQGARSVDATPVTRFSQRINDAINNAAVKAHLDPGLLGAFAAIESGGNPGARTGSYKGLFQLSLSEFQKHGGQGDIYDPQANADAAAEKIAQEAQEFEARYGRPPTATDLYLTHQQGVAGYAAHMANPDAPAWENMYSTGEGRQKGPNWAKRAIWGNIPTDVRSQFPGGVDSVTSRDFINIWDNKVRRFAGSYAQTPQAQEPAQAEPQEPQAQSELQAQPEKLAQAATNTATDATIGGQQPPLDTSQIPAYLRHLTPFEQQQALAARQAAMAKAAKKEGGAMREAAKFDINNDIARIKNGLEPLRRPDGLTAIEAAQDLFGDKHQHEFAELVRKTNAAHYERELKAPLVDMNYVDADTYLADKLPQENDPDYANKLEIYNAARKHLDDLADARIDDPAKASELSREVINAHKQIINGQQIGAGAPDLTPVQKNNLIMQARLDHQAKIGIPEDKRSALSKPEAKALMGIKSAEDMKRSDVMKLLDQAAERAKELYGPMARRAFEDAAGIVIKEATYTNSIKNKALTELWFDGNIAPATRQALTDAKSIEPLASFVDHLNARPRNIANTGASAIGVTIPTIKPSKEQIDLLRNHPEGWRAFDEKFKQPGLAAKYLGFSPNKTAPATPSPQDTALFRTAAPLRAMEAQ